MSVDPTGLPAVRKAARLLKTLGESEMPIGVTELSRLTGTHKSTVSRILRSLELEGLVIQDPLTHKFSPGPAFWKLAHAREHEGGLAFVARPHLLRLQQATRETVILSVFDGERAVTIDYVPSDLPLSYRAYRGDTTAAEACHSTAVGKVLLAFQPERHIDIVLSRTLPAFTEATVTDPHVLRAELAHIRHQGFATEVNEREEGLASLAAPVRGPGGRVKAALGVSGPTFRLSGERRQHVLEHLLEVAQAISSYAGYRPQRVVGANDEAHIFGPGT